MIKVTMTKWRKVRRQRNRDPFTWMSEKYRDMDDAGERIYMGALRAGFSPEIWPSPTNATPEGDPLLADLGQEVVCHDCHGSFEFKDVVLWSKIDEDGKSCAETGKPIFYAAYLCSGCWDETRSVLVSTIGSLFSGGLA